MDDANLVKLAEDIIKPGTVVNQNSTFSSRLLATEVLKRLKAPKNEIPESQEARRIAYYHVRKEHLRPGSARDVDPLFASYDVVPRREYERLLTEQAEQRNRELERRIVNQRGELADLNREHHRGNEFARKAERAKAERRIEELEEALAIEQQERGDFEASQATLLQEKTRAEQRIEKLQIVLRRKAVLDNYGITIENVKFDEWLEIVSSDEKLEEWFGEPLEDYILDEFAVAELLESYS